MIHIDSQDFDAVIIEQEAVTDPRQPPGPARLRPDARSRLERWRNAGLRLALLGPGDEPGLVEADEVRVHCVSPAACAEALHRLGLPRERTAMVAGTAAAVAAAREAGLGLVVAVDRDHGSLEDAGADAVVPDLDALSTPLREPDRLPAASDCLSRILEAPGRLAVFLDFDGTLAPIVSRPDDADLSDVARAAIRSLARRCTVAVVSGRDRADVAARVGVSELFYAGSHGFDISGPGGLTMAHEAGLAAVPDLDAAEAELRDRLGAIQGALVERKRFSVAVHWRNVAPSAAADVRRAVAEVATRHPGLRRGAGKMVAELRPDVAWDKGRAVRWILASLPQAGEGSFPLYLGDDVTDEDAFREVAEGGLGILVGRPRRLTAAACRLEDPDEVANFLADLAEAL